MASEGDRQALASSVSHPDQFAVLFHAHAAAIQRYVTRRVGVDAAVDVVAETFLVAFRKRHTYRDDRGSPRAWLYGIATNVVRGHRRTELKHLRLLAKRGLDPVTEPFVDQVTQMVSAQSLNSRLAAGLSRLPTAQRDAILLLAWAGLTYDEIAAATRVPRGTVQSRVSRARKKLRRSLGNRGAAYAELPSAAQADRLSGGVEIGGGARRGDVDDRA